MLEVYLISILYNFVCERENSDILILYEPNIEVSVEIMKIIGFCNDSAFRTCI